jgi:hypothetical protein
MVWCDIWGVDSHVRVFRKINRSFGLVAQVPTKSGVPPPRRNPLRQNLSSSRGEGLPRSSEEPRTTKGVFPVRRIISYFITTDLNN